MKRVLLGLSIFLFLSWLCPKAGAQGNQTVNNGDVVPAVKFTGAGCTYTWTNDNPAIGLAASGTGDIRVFHAVNKGSSAASATITATSPGLAVAYVTNTAGSSVSVIDLKTITILKTIPVGASPIGVAISPDGSRVYVANQTSHSISVISTATNSVTSTITLALGSYVTGVGISPDGGSLYVTDFDRSVLHVISTATSAITATISTGANPYGLAVTPDGGHVYTANAGDNTVSVINTGTNTLAANIPAGTTPNDVAINADGSRLYVTDYGSGNVSVINTGNYAIIAAIHTAGSAEDLALSPDGSRLYVTNVDDNMVSVVSTATNTVIGQITAVSHPCGISVSADGSRLYTTGETDKSLYIVNTATNSVIATVDVGILPLALGNFVRTACPPFKFTITVNPAPAVPPAITAGPAGGAISACAGTASSSPNIQQFTVSGSNLTSNIIATAPSGFEVSLTAGGSYSGSVTIAPSGGTVNNAVVYVRSAASASTGSIAGKVTLSAAGATNRTIGVKGTVNALPTVDAVNNQAVNSGAATADVKFAGTGNTFTWVNNTPGIGLPASGTGNIASFTAVNKSSSPVKATITVTPLRAGLAYIANATASTVSVINTITNEVVTTISVGHQQFPRATAVNPDGSKVYIVNFVGTVVVINTATNIVIATINVGSGPSGITISPDGNRAYVANANDGTVSILDLTTNTLVTTVKVGLGPQGILVSPDGARVYVANGTDKTISVINTANNTVISTIPVTLGAYELSVVPDGSLLYATSSGSAAGHTVTIINTATNTVSTTISVGQNPSGIAVNPDGSRMYVANAFSNTVSVINTATNSVIADIPVTRVPTGVSVSADGQWVYVTNEATGTVSVINAATNNVVSTIAVGSSPISLGNFITPGVSCSGPPTTFTIIVDPAAPPIITASAAGGAISACAGTASSSPNIQQVTVSGSNLTGDITATAPAGFEVSLSAATGYGTTAALKQSGGVVASTLVYVRSGASASAGNISGSVKISSPGATDQTVAVTGVVHTLPTVNQVSNQTVVNGSPVAAISFSGTGSTFTWVNDTPSIGLPASGTGNIPSFTAVNTGAAPVQANVTVTPMAGAFAYIANETENTVWVINTGTNAVIAKIPVGTTPYGVTVSPDGTAVYVSNFGSNNISVISTATNTIMATIPGVGPNPEGIGISPDGTRLYVANANVGTTTSAGTVSVINTATNAVISSITVGTRPTSVWVNADGSRLYVTNFLSNTVSVVNTADNTVIASPAVGTSPNLVAENPDGSRLYVTNANSKNVSVISTASNTVIATIGVGQDPDGLTISPDGSRVYVANGVSNTISVINTATNTVALTYTAVNQGPAGIALSNNGGLLYVENAFSNNVTVIDVTSPADKALATIPVGLHPGSIGGNFITGGTGVCSGVPTTFTITVNSSLAVITAGPVTGTISACAGTASTSPDVQQFTVSGNNLTASIFMAAPAGFEISTTPNSNFSSTWQLVAQNGVIIPTIVYVRSAATAPAGNISGKVALTSQGGVQVNVAVTGTVNALPTVNTISDQKVPNGAASAAVSFTGTGNTFTWTNDTPGIGLPASGTGDIASFTAVNTGSTPVKAKITVTPVATSFAYIANLADNTVSVVDTKTKSIVATIPVGVGPWGVSVSARGDRVYVTNANSNTVSVINTATNIVIATIPVGHLPAGLSASPDGSKVFVVNRISGTVSVINTSTNLVSATIPVGSQPIGITISPDGNKVYVANGASNSVSVINTTTNKIVATIGVGVGPEGISISADGTRLYVVNYAEGTVSIINSLNNSIVSTVTVGTRPIGVAISPDGSRVYVANEMDHTVSEINTVDNSVITIQVGASPECISVTPDGNEVYVTNEGSNNISVINAATNSVTTVNVGHGPISLGNFITSGTGCTGPPTTFTITVNPTALPPTITAGTATGTISSCQGTASSDPDIQQVVVSGNNLLDNIRASVPSVFEISLTPAGGYGSSVVIPQSQGKVGNTVLYVRASATAPAGVQSGFIDLSSGGATSQTAAIAETINALPTVNAVNNQKVANGAATKAVSFTGTATSFTWTNDTPGIGLSASGTGDIASFTAVNTGSSPVKATIAATPVAQGFAYIANYGSNTVSVINTTTKTVVSTIPVGTNPWGVAVGPGGGMVYVTNQQSGTVSVINSKTNAVVSAITVGTSPEGVAISPDGSRLYVANLIDGTISVINTAANTLAATIRVGPNLQGIVVSPDGSRVYVTSSNLNAVFVINTATNAVITSVSVDTAPIDLAVSPDGSRVYVTNLNSNDVSVINTATNTVVSTIAVGANPAGVSISSDGSRVYVANGNSSTVSVINTATNTVISTIAAADVRGGLSVSPDGRLLYLENFGSGTVSVVDISTSATIATINVGSFPDSKGSFITAGSGCTGQPTSFTITVTPSQVMPSITTGSVSGNITACAGTASVSPQLEQFTVSGSNLTAGIEAAAPAGFEISLSPGSGFGAAITIPQTSGTVAAIPVYLRSSALAATGSISGSVTLKSAGATDESVAINGVVNAIPSLIIPSNQVFTSGDLASGVTFSTTANTITWVNDKPGIGLAAGGTGNIAPFTAVNTGTTPIVATITATPLRSSFAYIPNSNDGTLTVINTATNTLVTTIAFGSNVRPFGVSVSPDGGRVYVTDRGSGNLLVINTATNAVIATVNVGLTPEGVLVSPDGSRVYVANQGSNNISVISTATNAVITTVAAGIGPIGVSLNPDGSRLYVSHANSGANTVSVINTASYALMATIAVGSFSSGLTISPDGSHVYVANQDDNTVSVISTANNVVIATINVGSTPEGISASPDGSRVYVSNFNSNSISVINTATNQVIGTIAVGITPYGVSVSADGSQVYVANVNSATVSVINTATNTLTATIPVGSNPVSFGNFLTNGGCTGTAAVFTITVNPVPTTSGIVTGPVSGTITACEGTASTNPHIQNFTVSGNHLTHDIGLAAPNNFEISLSAGGSYGSTLTLAENAGTVDNTIIYVRSSALAASPSILGDVDITSVGSPAKKVSVTGTINALPTVNAPGPQNSSSGKLCPAVIFGGTADIFNWTNDNPSIGLAASGTGNIAAFTAINNGKVTVTATITVTPLNNSGCDGAPVQFIITVQPEAPAVIAADWTLSPLNTIYGTPSTAAAFTVSGKNMSGGILVSPPPGFEVSTDDVTFSSTVSAGSAGAIAPVMVYIRLAAITPVGNYSDYIKLTSPGASDVTQVMPLSTVTPAALTITADNKTRFFGQANPVFTLSYSGFVNNEGPAVLTSQPVVSTIATAASLVGQYPISVSGASAHNYSPINYVDGILTINSKPAGITIPNTFTPNGDGINDTWNIKNLEFYVNCTVQVFNRYGQVVFSSVGYGVSWGGTYNGTPVPVGTYYYIINLQDGSKVISGFVAVIK